MPREQPSQPYQREQLPKKYLDGPQEPMERPYVPKGYERPPPGFNPQFYNEKFGAPYYDPVYADDRFYRPISAPYSPQK